MRRSLWPLRDTPRGRRPFPRACAGVRRHHNAWSWFFAFFDLLKIARQAQSGFYIRVLSALVSSCEQNEHCTSNFFEVHPVTGTVVDPQFGTPSRTGWTSPGIPVASRSILTWALARARTSRKLSSELAKSSVLRISSTGQRSLLDR